MCGIFALLNNYNLLAQSFVEEQFDKGRRRGPEFSIIEPVLVQCQFGFHRLAINGLNATSNQPLRVKNITLICNGEIYNYKELYELMQVKPTTHSDCEVIIHLYLKYGIEQTLQMLDGVFSFCLIDRRFAESPSKLYIARDPYGVRPLYTMNLGSTDDAACEEIDHTPVYGFASEMKSLICLAQTLNTQLDTAFRKQHTNPLLLPSPKPIEYAIHQFSPGTYSLFEMPMELTRAWTPVQSNVVYHTPGFQSCALDQPALSASIFQGIQKYLQRAVFKRCATTDRPIACLLSGGLDSSLIAALVNEYHKKHGLPTLETYSIGLSGASDLAYAQQVATYLGTKHTEIVLSEQEFLDAIPAVIYDIESYDTTTVRASIGNWLIGKHIAAHSEAKVIFNGDGSDELTGGYLYMSSAPDAIEFDRECRRLLKDIYLFDVLRSDKSISSHGLEPRTPFLDREWVQFYLSIPIHLRFHEDNGKMEKYLLRTAFSGEHYLNSDGLPILPEEILWRRKEAFSDGVSKQTRSLYEIIGEYAQTRFMADDFPKYAFLDETTVVFEEISMLQTAFSHLHQHLFPTTAEKFYYRKIFEEHYRGQGRILPYFWMPKYVIAKDASARTLSTYTNNPSNE